MEEERDMQGDEEENEEEEELNEREIQHTKHHRHHDQLNAENLKEKLVDIDIGKQMSPRYDLFSSTDFFFPDVSADQQEFTSNSFWRISAPISSDLPDLD